MDDPEVGEDGNAPPPPSLIEPILVVNYIKRTVPALMEDDPSEITSQFEVTFPTIQG